jgi:cyclic beta-1,2-glucan synthetase
MTIPASLETILADLTTRHRSASDIRLRRPTGAHIKRQLHSRLEDLTNRATTLPESVHWQLVGLDWLDQNQHVVREAIEEIGSSLPGGYLRRLPTIETAAGATELRVQELAKALVEYGGLPIDLASIEGFLSAYQLEVPLSLGELWALPTFLRIEVVNNLCDALQTGMDLAARGAEVNDEAEIAGVLSGAFLSLRTISATQWRQFVERQSVVERILAEDPSGAYSKMDAASRNRYRERVEKLAVRLNVSESSVANTAVELSATAASTILRERHVGHYLTGRGIGRLETSLYGKRSFREWLGVRNYKTRSRIYLLAISIPTVASLIVVSSFLTGPQLNLAGKYLLLALALVPVLTIWTEIVNWLITQILAPRTLPKLDFSRRIPNEHITMVAVPCMLTNAEEIDHLLQNLETNYLGNDDPQLRFALLSDYVDADVQNSEADRDLLAHAVQGIDTLNSRYGTAQARPFALLHRERLWNESGSRWMGWERKRGKIEELNRWLLGAEDTSFSLIHGDSVALHQARNVITLDADNQLLPGSAAELIGALAHPLNQPQFDSDSGCVVAGYSLIQPRVDIHPASANQTIFSRLMSGETGIDLYHSAVSEVYQDFFGQGIYAGKGIYDIRAFSRSLEGLIPANTVLSHDLLEGVLSSAGLASDIIVLENASANLSAELKRQHRWIRGDWQLLPWLLSAGGGENRQTGLDLLGRWKLFDNLRRSLLPPALFALFLAGWILMPASSGIWTLAIVLIPALGILYSVFGEIRHGALRWGTLRSTVLRTAGNLGKRAAQWLVNLAVLPIVAYTALDAICRTLARVFITRRHLLEWTPAAQTDRAAAGTGLAGSYRRHIIAPLSGLAALSVAAFTEPAAIYAVPLGLSWCFAPLLTWLMAREPGEQERLSADDATELRLLARRTWQFYERFVGPETHWLPPDNYQETPKLSVADRTSPTNVGLFLLASVAALDLGYLGASGLITRIDETTSTLLRMRRFRGHWFNWYSTKDLTVLAPDYVSTVDSGNLLASLLVCRAALQNIDETRLAHLRAATSLTDIVANIEDILESVMGPAADAETDAIYLVLSTLRTRLARTPESVDAWAKTVAEIRDELCAGLDAAVLQLVEKHDARCPAAKIEALRIWVIQLRYEADNLQSEIARLQACWPDVLVHRRRTDEDAPMPRTLGELIERLDASAACDLGEMLALRDRVVRRIDDIVAATDFRFLFDDSRKLFHIGYNNTTGELDASYYDLLASEARIASLIAIAKGDIPVGHWVHLGRPLRRIGGMRVVLSWSATAFEYLMPRIFMECPRFGLLDSSCRAVIREQRKLTRHTDAPWGLSESAYFELNSSGHFKYYAFGVNSLALRRSTRNRYVVSPYASILALPFNPLAVVKNLIKLKDIGCWGRYGLYEALDYSEDPSAKSKPRIVQTFMAHHQGMILASITNALHDDALVRRFHSVAAIRAVEHLLYESLPKRAQDRIVRHMPPPRPRVIPVMTAEHISIAAARSRRCINVIGNGHLTVRTTGRGSGDIIWNGQSISRWQPRTMGPDGGDRIYLSDVAAGDIHVLGVPDAKGQPAAEVWNAPYQTEIHQRFGAILARLTVGVAADNDVVLKRVTLTNETANKRTVRVAHYAEIVLAHAAEDQRHPAFNKLFIESEQLHDAPILLFGRRPRSASEAGLFCATGVIVSPEFKPTISMETDRRAFLGRGGGYGRPAALTDDIPAQAAGSAGSLDPIAAMTVTLELPPGHTAQIVFLVSASGDRTEAIELIRHFRSLERVTFGYELARRRAAAELTGLGIGSDTVVRLLEIYADMIWPGSLTEHALAQWDLRESILGVLWSRGISGDFPICMMCSRQQADRDRAERLLILQTYLAQRGVPIDIIFIDESPSSYAEQVRTAIEDLVERYWRPHQRNHSFILAGSSLSPSERASINAAALVHFEGDAGLNGEIRDRRFAPRRELPDFIPTHPPLGETASEYDAVQCPALEFDNGYGGIDADNGDYVIRYANGAPTPAPWINVLANPTFGTIISERGAASTWYGNSSEHRLTPWYNDPVTDRSGEAVYIRDEETGEIWSPLPWPMPDSADYLARHGAGYSGFEHASHQLVQKTECFVDKEHAAKCIRVQLRNTAERARRLTLTYYAEWVFGNHYEDASPFIIPEISPDHATLLARNVLPRSGSERVAFITATTALHSYTTDRREFLGTARNPARPEALHRIGLSDEVVAAGEPCCAYQVHVDLAAAQEADIVFTLGAAENRDAAILLASQFHDLEFAHARQLETRKFWQDILQSCQIKTPNRALDVLFNHWLLYQNLACRLWARTGLYQAAGGFGFRDQLQDSLALVHARPELTRAQILRACSVQFAEGDVLHWWHETPLRGVRTHCSDDLLWLPYAVSEYTRITGDLALLDEEIPYLNAEPLRPDEDDRYAEYTAGGRTASVYEHCLDAIEARAATGMHGLPFIGTGDWNDGLNRVGVHGRGESAWLGWFLADVCERFAEITEARGDPSRAATLRERRASLVEALEKQAWDGAWYRRAYYDDGSPLGSDRNTECQIDLNAQTWPVITGFADPQRAGQALDAATERLINENARLITLLAPPFSRTLKDPGYIKGYPPGVRENGGQYTHAATWAVWAATCLDRADQAMQWTDILNPLLRTDDKAGVDRYRGEPYVLAGDIYSVAPRVGQVGWTWYTGSAGWVYRIVLEQLLGIQPVHGNLTLHPCVPSSWTGFEVEYAVGNSVYSIAVHDPAGIAEAGAAFELDGQAVDTVELLDDARHHAVMATKASRRTTRQNA